MTDHAPRAATPPAETIDLAELEKNAGKASVLLKAMSNERRLMVLCQLAHHGERSVGELAPLVGLGQSALSQHLARLRRDRLVATRRDAQTIYYRLASGEAEAMLMTLYEVYCGGGPKAIQARARQG
jgi:ArsR family transcriptional regulator, virulence genes transcriptional regulator